MVWRAPSNAAEPNHSSQVQSAWASTGDVADMTPRRLVHRLRFWRNWGRELPAEIGRRLRPLEEAGEKQVIIDIWVLRQLLNRPPRMAAERPTKLTKEVSDELIAEAEDELAVLREKAKGRRLRKEEIDPIIADLRRLTGWSEATVVDRLKLSKKRY
jgi:hypothetical protein